MVELDGYAEVAGPRRQPVDQLVPTTGHIVSSGREGKRPAESLGDKGRGQPPRVGIERNHPGHVRGHQSGVCAVVPGRPVPVAVGHRSRAAAVSQQPDHGERQSPAKSPVATEPEPRQGPKPALRVRRRAGGVPPASSRAGPCRRARAGPGERCTRRWSRATARRGCVGLVQADLGASLRTGDRRHQSGQASADHGHRARIHLDSAGCGSRPEPDRTIPSSMLPSAGGEQTGLPRRRPAGARGGRGIEDRIDHLCAIQGVTKGSFYYHFDDMADYPAQLDESLRDRVHHPVYRQGGERALARGCTSWRPWRPR